MTTQSTTDPLPAGTTIGRTALRVAALDELTAFYRDVVGLEVLSKAASGATLGASDQPLLVLEAAPDAPPRPETATGLYHTAFRVPTRAALGDALGRVRDHWRLDGASDHLVSEALYLTDPEGNGVELYRDRPRDDWPRTDDGAVRMATEPLDLDGVTEAAADGTDENGASEDRAPAGTDVGHVHLEVSSLDEFRSFYVDVLGFEQQTTYPGASFVSAGGYHHHVGANTWNQRSTAAAGRGLSWFEVVVPDADTLDAVRDRLTADGSANDGSANDGVVVEETAHGIAISDPDGIELRFRAAATD